MTDIVIVPAAPVVPPFPPLGAPNFNNEAYTWGVAMPGVSDGVKALADTARTNATAAQERAAVADAASKTAQAAATAAAAAVNATEWGADVTYERGAAVWSPTNFLTYRRTIAGSGGDDPAIDAAGAWEQIGGLAEILRPEVALPLDGASDVMDGPIFQLSAYYSLYDIQLKAARVQASEDAGFGSVFWDSGDVLAGSDVKMPSGIMNTSTTYYWRGQYIDDLGNRSGWAAGSFTTTANFSDYIATPAATPAAFGDPLEGGFYAGMIWNELVQSASSTVIGTGVKTFAVPSMSGAPIVYAGQTLEVRSRANPANKMIGTVTGAIGTSLTLNITSVGGSGTFADWSIMSRYRVIVAPKASGENAALAWKNANDAGPAATGTLTEGRKSTLAMVAAGTSTVYPAAHWCNNLSISGKTDWYLPARDELELCWRNLKPTTTANYITADRSTAATPNYQNLGAYGGTEATHGLNKNSSPAGAAYTSSVPGQAAATAFRTGGAEAYEFGSSYYWSSSEYGASSAWLQYWYSSTPGGQNGDYGKTLTYRVRAVRRSII